MEKKNTTQNILIPTYKSTGVVISDCFGITKSLQKRIRLENDIFDFLWKYVSVIKNVSVMLQYAINSSWTIFMFRLSIVLDREYTQPQQ